MTSTDAKSLIIRTSNNNNNDEIVNTDDKRSTKFSSLDDEILAKNENSICCDKTDTNGIGTDDKLISNTGISQRANREKQKAEQVTHPDNASVPSEKISAPEDSFDELDDLQHVKTKVPPVTRCPDNVHIVNGVDSKKDVRQDCVTDENKSVEEILALMETVNKLVKAAQFGPTLGGHIISLYNYLKKHGHVIESTRKVELNQVFVSVRQACCRDGGQLGTPCRLKMMELIELRAMKWRPSLAHSQYYLERSTQQRSGAAFPEKTKHPSLSVDNPLEKQERCKASCENLAPAPLSAPVSAPPFGGLPVNPFTFNLHTAPAMNPMAAGEMMHHASSPMTPISPAPAPSYFLVPAAHASPGGIAFFPTPAQCLLPNAASMMHPSALAPRFGAPVALNPLAAGNLSPMADFPKGAVLRSCGNLTRPVKIPGKNQFRDEIVIRNADSGKIMGVKGRRVSIIEELSGSVISFQKVAQNAKERILTITGPSEESILHARVLIEDTIRRNVSPDRGANDGAELPARTDLDSSVDSSGSCGSLGKAREDKEETDEETECALSEMGSVLKLSCADPNVLKVARKALNDYFNRQETTLLRRCSGGEPRSSLPYGKERRKSMPLPLHKLENLMEANESGSQTPKTPDDLAEQSEKRAASVLQSKLNARSIPNLSGAVHDRANSARIFNGTADRKKGSGLTKIVYTRDFLLQCSNACSEMRSPVALNDVADTVHEVLLSNGSMFDASAYKKKFTDFKVHMRA